MNWSSYLYAIPLLYAVSVLLKSCFYFLSANKKGKNLKLSLLCLAIISGIFHLLYNYVQITTSFTALPFTIFLTATAYVFYSVSRTKRDAEYTLTNSVADAYVLLGSHVKKEFSSKKKGISSISYDQLESFEFGKIYWIDGIAIIRRTTAYDGLFFITIFPPDTEMNEQQHPDCDEWCGVLQGQMIDTLTGNTYKENDIAIWKKGEPHAPKSGPNEKLILHVYFNKT